MNDSFSDSFSEEVPLGDFDEPAGLEALFEGGDDVSSNNFCFLFLLEININYLLIRNHDYKIRNFIINLIKKCCSFHND